MIAPARPQARRAGRAPARPCPRPELPVLPPAPGPASPADPTQGPAPGDPLADPVDRALLDVADTIGELMGFWNFKPSLGRVWTVLYLSPRPLSADEIVERAGLSAGGVSMSLHELLEWGVVRKADPAGARKRHYEAETDILAMVTKVFRERELRLIDEAVARLEAAASAIAAAPGRPDRAFVTGRLGDLLRLARAGRAVVDRFSQAGMLDLRGIRHALSPRR